jgi:hypothetical protein
MGFEGAFGPLPKLVDGARQNLANESDRFGSLDSFGPPFNDLQDPRARAMAEAAYERRVADGQAASSELHSTPEGPGMTREDADAVNDQRIAGARLRYEAGLKAAYDTEIKATGVPASRDALRYSN